MILTAAQDAPSTTSGSSAVYRYHPKQRIPPSLESIQKQLAPGEDAFPAEKQAAELAVRFDELAARLRERPGRIEEAVEWLLAPEFKGAPLRPTEEVSSGDNPRLEIFEARTIAKDLTLDRSSFRKELAALVSDFNAVQTAEFLITSIDVERPPDALVRTVVRFDLAGTAKEGWRAERLGRWQMRWMHGSDSQWRVSEWVLLDHVRSRTAAPVFTEVTDAAFGGNASFRNQLVPGLDEWSSRLDGVFKPGGMGHHGVSVGDFDGDGLDDIYVSQPEGLPNRLFRNNGDGTFIDVTEAAGVGVLDRTSQSLFADVDNDGDQDLILLTRSGPLLFLNDGHRFTRAPDAFKFKEPLQGSLTSAALIDYDRDGFLDLYLCAYGYFIGVSEDKAGPPSPYHDAQNGSPNVLMRNDGHGHFVDVTKEVGLDQNNDRFSFAAAWADYDEDGWPDLLVANDFGRKNLYHNEESANGRRHFKDVAAAADVEDYGAGMSAAFLDYDNDGHLDIYTGNMWTAAGQRVTAQPGFKPDASPEIREIYRRHTRGNSLFRNRGDGTFADVTLDAHAEFGRWAWASDAFDFDNDGWQDLYIVNGMFTRDRGEDAVDVDSFFWRQVVAQSPLARKPGTAYDDGWRATNRLLVSNGAQAQHERNVLMRNNGHGGFDDVSGSTGLDLDQDGRSFAVFDYDGDGDADVVLLAPRSSPQLRLFRNDFASRNAAIAMRLIGTKSNRDAVGARVTIETDTTRATRIVTAGSGFISQHSKQLLFGFGRSQRITKATIVWPSGLVQTLSDLPLNQRLTVEEGSGAFRSEPFRSNASTALNTRASATNEREAAFAGTWLYEPFPAPDFTLRDVDGHEHSLSALAGHPALIHFWATWAPPSRTALDRLSKQRDALAAAGASILALAVDSKDDAAKVRSSVQNLGLSVMIAGEEVAGTYNVLHRYLFDRREDLRLPTTLLLNAKGEIVKIYSGTIPVNQIVRDIATADVSPADRLTRAVPFRGTFESPPGERSYFQYGLELSEQGFDRPALTAFERVAQLDPSAITFYNLGTLYMKLGRPGDARTALERALSLTPDYADAHNTLGVLLAQDGDFKTAIEHFKKALDARPDYADALNNLGYVLFQAGRTQDAYQLYEQALRLQPTFPEALNNLGIFYGQQRDFERAETYFRRAVGQRPGYGEAANNLALVLNARGDGAGAIALLERLLKDNPGFEPGYLTLIRLLIAAGQPDKGLQVLQQLLQRNPTHPQGLQLLKQLQGTMK